MKFYVAVVVLCFQVIMANKGSNVGGTDLDDLEESDRESSSLEPAPTIDPRRKKNKRPETQKSSPSDYFSALPDQSFQVKPCGREMKIISKMSYISNTLKFLWNKKKEEELTPNEENKIAYIVKKLKTHLDRLNNIRKKDKGTLKAIQECKMKEKIEDFEESINKILLETASDLDRRSLSVAAPNNQDEEKQKSKPQRNKKTSKLLYQSLNHNKYFDENYLTQSDLFLKNEDEFETPNPIIENEINHLEEQYSDFDQDATDFFTQSFGGGGGAADPYSFGGFVSYPEMGDASEEEAEDDTNLFMARSFNSGGKSKNSNKWKNPTKNEDGEHGNDQTNKITPQQINDFIDHKQGTILKEPSCPSAWNSFLPITFIPQAKRASNEDVICTDPFIKQLSNKPQVRLIIASQVASWNIERSEKIQSDVFKSWQLRACLETLPNQVFLHIDNSLRNTTDSARRLFNEFQTYYKLKNLAGLTFYWPSQGSKLKFLKEVTKLLRVVRFYFEPRPVKLVLTADKVFIVGFPNSFDMGDNVYVSEAEKEYKHHFNDPNVPSESMEDSMRNSYGGTNFDDFNF